MSRIINYIMSMVPYMIIGIPIVIVFRFFRFKQLKGRNLKTSLWHEIGILAFFIFIIGLASQTVLPQIGNVMVNGSTTGTINLVPFRVIIDTYKEVFERGNIHALLINFIGNIALFVPIGFFIPLLWNKITFGKTVLIGFLSSLFIEICQIPQSRSTDIDDLWLNTLGVIIGFGIYAIINKTIPKISEKFKI